MLAFVSSLGLSLDVDVADTMGILGWLVELLWGLQGTTAPINEVEVTRKYAGHTKLVSVFG
jgi:hypothetical protein